MVDSLSLPEASLYPMKNLSLEEIETDEAFDETDEIDEESESESDILFAIVALRTRTFTCTFGESHKLTS